MSADTQAELLKEARDVLRQYTGVVESVNDPDNFHPHVRDAGLPARDLIDRIDAALAKEHHHANATE